MIGIIVVSSFFCFLVFLGLINLIKVFMPPLSPLFIPSNSSIIIAIFLVFFCIKLNTFLSLILCLVIWSTIVLFLTSPASYFIIS